MSALPDTDSALRDLESLLLSAPQGELESWTLEPRVREVLRLLATQEPHWIGADEAKGLLGVVLDETVPALARLDVLRSRTLSDGCLQVRLDDVLHERLVREALLGIGGDDLSPEELRVMSEARPGTNPWNRAKVEPQPS